MTRTGPFVRLVAFTVAVFVVMTLLAGSDRFLTTANFQSIAFQLPELALLSFAMMLSMLTGGIDLSIVSIANLSSIVAAMTMVRIAHGDAGAGASAIAAGIGAGLCTGLACGAVNGCLVAFVRVPSILVTLGTLQLFTGLALVLTGGQAIVGLPDAFQWLGNGTFLAIPVPLWLCLGAATVMAMLVNRTVFGVEARLVGTNPIAAWFAALPVRSVLVRTYVTTALIASVTGILMVSRANSAKADYGSSYLLQSILVVVLAGVNPAGGSARVLGVGIAVFALELLSSGFGMMRLTSFATELAWGAFLLLVMVINSVLERRG
ncbi:MAG TPA: ABC transporter permease [Vicinamibacterales bacterium]|jgi:simple sugar transport system permease protein|nr:ABC transporter permease [Vicinamibacterales bacterium]